MGNCAPTASQPSKRPSPSHSGGLAEPRANPAREPSDAGELRIAVETLSKMPKRQKASVADRF